MAHNQTENSTNNASLQRPQNCSVCQNTLSGDYCQHCGQKWIKTKNGILEVFNIFFLSIISVEKGLVGAMINLSKNPRFIVTNYWKGFRKYHLSPGQMIIYASFTIGLHLAFVNKNILGFTVTLTGLDDTSSAFFSPQMMFIILTIPFFSITTYLFYLKQKRTFVEHLIATAYIFSYAVIVGTIIGDLGYLIFNASRLLSTLVFFFVLFGWGIRVYSTKSKWYSQVLEFILLIIGYLVVMAITGLIMYLSSPESFKYTPGQ